MHTHFTKYETARIIGARALQIAMDAPLLLKLSDAELKEMRYDPLKIAQRELDDGVLPINIHRPLPKKRFDKLKEVKEEEIDDQKIIEKEKEIEEEIVEKAVEEGFAAEDDVDNLGDEPEAKEE
ncbi:MAG: DNA-directed RNA polymerase subunit K [Nanoarchaeota archaeon]